MTTERLATKADLLVLAVEGLFRIANESTAGGEPVSICDVLAVKDLAEEIQLETGTLAQWSDDIERLVGKED